MTGVDLVWKILDYGRETLTNLVKKLIIIYL
jgi:hypothetical protein